MSAVLANISDAISDRNIARFYFIATYRVARQMNDIPVDIKTLVFANRTFKLSAFGVNFRRNVFEL